MIISENNNIREYSNEGDIQNPEKQFGGTPSTVISDGELSKYDIEQLKIQMKIYVRMFLYIQFKLNKKFDKSSSSGNSMNRLTQKTLIDSMQR